MQFDLADFRRFHKSYGAQISPITVLVGENSSGKNSFAAGFRYIIETMSARAEGSFNREPFFLGAYDQIAHYRGGRFGRAPIFKLSLKITKQEIKNLNLNPYSNSFFSINDELTDVSIDLHFENARSQPILKNVCLENDFVSVSMDRESLPGLSIKKKSEKTFTSIKAPKEGIFFKPVSSVIDRNSLSPFYSAIQNWSFFMSQAIRKKDKSVSMDNDLFSLLNKATLGAYIFSDDVVYASAPFRTKPERTYSPIEASSSAEGSHIPILLAQAKAFDTKKWSIIKSTLEEFGVRSGMFKKIDVKRLGSNQSDPFQIIITVSKDRSNLIDVGYGVSQILPLIGETLINDTASFFIFQQPEVHLHPKAQAELGSYFVDFVLRSNKYVMLETHSDFIIDRIRSELKSRNKDPNEFLSVLYFERDDIETCITRIQFDKDGNVDNPPVGYRNFFLREAARNFGFDI